MEQIPFYKPHKSANNNPVQSEAEEMHQIPRVVSFLSARRKIYNKERDTDMRKLLSLAAALAAAGALTIGASANGGVVGGVVNAGEDIVNGVVDAGEDIVDGVTGSSGSTGNTANGTTAGSNGTSGGMTSGTTNTTAGANGTTAANGTNGAASGTNGAATPGNPNTGVPFSMAAVGAAALGLAGVALSCRRDG